MIGEGAGILILESLEHAQRAARTFSPRSSATACPATPITSPQPAENGDGAYRVMRAAIRDAKARAAADRLRQRARHFDAARRRHRNQGHEARLRRARQKVAVSSTKSMTGHLLGGAGGLEAGISVLALRDQILPPTINHEDARPGLRSGLRPEPRAQGRRRVRAVELLRLRRHQRRAGVQALGPAVSSARIRQHLTQGLAGAA